MQEKNKKAFSYVESIYNLLDSQTQKNAYFDDIDYAYEVIAGMSHLVFRTDEEKWLERCHFIYLDVWKAIYSAISRKKLIRLSSIQSELEGKYNSITPRIVDLMVNEAFQAVLPHYPEYESDYYSEIIDNEIFWTGGPVSSTSDRMNLDINSFIQKKDIDECKIVKEFVEELYRTKFNNKSTVRFYDNKITAERVLSGICKSLFVNCSYGILKLIHYLYTDVYIRVERISTSNYDSLAIKYYEAAPKTIIKIIDEILKYIPEEKLKYDYPSLSHISKDKNANGRSASKEKYIEQIEKTIYNWNFSREYSGNTPVAIAFFLGELHDIDLLSVAIAPKELEELLKNKVVRHKCIPTLYETELSEKYHHIFIDKYSYYLPAFTNREELLKGDVGEETIVPLSDVLDCCEPFTRCRGFVINPWGIKYFIDVAHGIYDKSFISFIKGKPTDLHIDAVVRFSIKRLAAKSKITIQAMKSDSSSSYADHIIYADTPKYSLKRNSDRLLSECYSKVLDSALLCDCLSVAIPAVTDYPIAKASKVALDTVALWLNAHPNVIMNVYFCLENEDTYNLYRENISEIEKIAEWFGI